jgi:hypothetical protein
MTHVLEGAAKPWGHDRGDGGQDGDGSGNEQRA